MVEDRCMREGNSERQTSNFWSIAKEVISEDTSSGDTSLTTREGSADLRDSLFEELIG